MRIYFQIKTFKYKKNKFFNQNNLNLIKIHNLKLFEFQGNNWMYFLNVSSRDIQRQIDKRN